VLACRGAASAVRSYSLISADVYALPTSIRALAGRTLPTSGAAGDRAAEHHLAARYEPVHEGRVPAPLGLPLWRLRRIPPRAERLQKTRK